MSMTEPKYTESERLNAAIDWLFGDKSGVFESAEQAKDFLKSYLSRGVQESIESRIYDVLMTVHSSAKRVMKGEELEKIYNSQLIKRMVEAGLLKRSLSGYSISEEGRAYGLAYERERERDEQQKADAIARKEGESSSHHEQ